MAVGVNSIPSVNVPFTDSRGRINPIWHEFLRSFVSASVDGTIVEGGSTPTVTAGNGLIGGGTGDVTLAVGAGSGIAVNADEVSLDFTTPSSVAIALDDGLLFSDSSDNNNVSRAQVRDLIALNAPGGVDSNVQYNDNGIFAGDDNFTYDGAGSAFLSTELDVGGLVAVRDEGTTGYVRFGGTTTSNDPYISGNAASGISWSAGVSGFDNGTITAGGAAGAGKFLITLNSTSGDGTIALTGDSVHITNSIQFHRAMRTNLTASTTQTQGQGALLSDYNNVTVVANNNDTVTLPAAEASRYCLVRNSGANTLQIFPASGDNLGYGVNTATTLRTGSHMVWFAIDATTWHQLDGDNRQTVVSGITASTTQTQGQGPLTRDVNEVSTVANANDTVTLPSATAYSRTITIINNGANTLQIFPASGDNLGAGVDTATTLASGSNVRYTNYDATNWEAV